MKLAETFVTICVSYTIISITATVINMLTGQQADNLNVISMFVLSSIAVLVLSLHRLFEEWSPLMMIIVQYVIAMGLVLLFIFVAGLFRPVAEGGYRDIFVSFTIPYIIGAAIYYVSVFQTAKQQNEILQEIKQIRKDNVNKE